MKKFLISTLVAASVATCAGALVACGGGDDSKDAENAQKVIGTIRTLYESKPEITDADYKVLGKVSNYTVKWEVSSTFPNYGNYIVVGEPDPNDNNQITVSITKATEEIVYTLKATVKVGSASKSAEFNRKIPAGAEVLEGQSTKTLSFADDTTRVSQTADKQVWEANGIKLINDKYTSASDVIDASNPVRIYAGSSVKIERDGMTTVVFRSAAKAGTSDYPANLKAALEAAKEAGEFDGTIEEDTANLAYTVKLANPLCVLEFTSSKQIRLSSIDIVYNNAGVTDENKVTEAKKLLDLAEKKYGLITEYDLPATKNGAAVTWAVKDGGDYASITTDGKLKVNSMPDNNADVTLTATIKSNSAEQTKDITVTLVPLGITNDGTAEHPLTPSEAVKVAKLLNLKQTSAKTYYVKGFAIVVGDYNSNYGSFGDTYIADEYASDKTATATDAILVYGLKPDSEYLSKDEKLNRGDEVTLKCLIQNYQEAKQELVSATCVAREAVEKTDAEIVAEAKADKAKFLTKTKFTAVDTEGTTLPTSYTNGATLKWTVAENDYVEIVAGKLKIKALPEGAETVTLNVEIASGDEKDTTTTVDITVKTVVPLAAGTYKLAINQSGKTLYFKGTIANNFGAATDNVLEAADVVVEKTTDGYTLKVGDQYIEVVTSGTYINFGLVATSTGYWQFNEDLEVLTWTLNNVEYFMGTYGTNARFGVSAKGYLDGTISSSYAQYPAGFEVFNPSAQEKVTLALGAVNAKLDNVTAVNAEGIALPTPNAALTGVTFAWALADDNDEDVSNYVSVVDGDKLVVTALPTEANVTVKLVVTATCGETVVTDNTKNVTVELIKAGTESDSATVNYVEKYSEKTDLNGVDVSDKQVTITFAKSNGSTNPQLYTGTDAGVRAYAKNTITVKVANGYEINQITITYVADKYTTLAVTVDKGTYESGVWTGTAQEVVFTVGADVSSGHNRIVSIKVDYVSTDEEGGDEGDEGDEGNAPALEAIIDEE